ncbi:MAG: hypothetical protein U0470_04940 [Anaerolineae bacterium]
MSTEALPTIAPTTTATTQPVDRNGRTVFLPVVSNRAVAHIEWP